MEWRTFDLHPEYPPQGLPRADLTRKYGDGIEAHTRRLIEGAGFVYSPPDVVPRTRLALSLTEMARDQGRLDDMVARLYRAYWSEGVDLTRPEELSRLAGELGLNVSPTEVEALETTHGPRVDASTREMLAIGFNGVPAFVVDESVGISGAQPHRVFEEAMAQLGHEAAPEGQPE